MKDPVDHIVREPLPWREPEVTHCGRSLAETKQVTTREQAWAMVRDLGKKRAAYALCMTCLETAHRNPTWEESPMGRLRRDVAPLFPRDDGLTLELRAIAILIEAHRAEFDELVAGLGAASDLSAARQARRQERG